MKSRIHYAWVILVCCIPVAGAYGLFYSFGVFFKPLQAEFGWGRGLTSSIHSVHLLAFAVSTVVLGKLTDKYGPRLAVSVGAVLLGIGFWLCSRVQNLGQFYLFYAITSLGAGVIWSPPIATVQRWFTKRKGLAIGLVTAGIGLGTLVYAPLSNYVIDAYGWRTAYIIIGCGSAFIVLLAALPLVSSPQKMGLVAYGGTNPAPVPAENRTAVISEGWSMKEAIRTKAFIVVTIIYCCTVLPIHLVAVHLVPYATDAGIDKTVAAAAFGLVGAFSIPGRIGFSALADRIGWSKSLTITCAGCFITIIWLIFTGNLWMLYFFVVFYGFFYGGKTPLVPGLVGHFFGNRSLAELIGFTHGISLAVSALGPIMAGWIFDITGSYVIAFVITACFWLTSAILAAVVKPPVKKTMGQ